MTTTVSSKGQVVIPRLARARLHLVAGSKLECEITGDAILLRPLSPRRKQRVRVVDEISGLRVTRRSGTAPAVTSDMVKAIMAEFP